MGAMTKVRWRRVLGNARVGPVQIFDVEPEARNGATRRLRTRRHDLGYIETVLLIG